MRIFLNHSHFEELNCLLSVNVRFNEDEFFEYVLKYLLPNRE